MGKNRGVYKAYTLSIPLPFFEYVSTYFKTELEKNIISILAHPMYVDVGEPWVRVSSPPRAYLALSGMMSWSVPDPREERDGPDGWLRLSVTARPCSLTSGTPICSGAGTSGSPFKELSSPCINQCFVTRRGSHIWPFCHPGSCTGTCWSY